jgi:hypothetical protein
MPYQRRDKDVALLGYDLEPNRVYREATRVGNELKRIGPEVCAVERGHRCLIRQACPEDT